MATDTIVAIATAPGRGGVGIVRASGPKALTLAQLTLGFAPKPRHAHFCDFVSKDGDTLDKGIALFFPNPHSFTGEDVFELQGHGGPVILDLIVDSLISMGARLARPGEFSERAFLNDKMDLTQAEAIADLINASSKHAAKQALNSLKGEFSKQVQVLVEKLTHLRMYVESAIDFPEEEIDFLSDGKVATDLQAIIDQVSQVEYHAQQGVLVSEGMKVVIAGRPNAGKSSLLNALSEKDSAIVTDIAGTTRDLVRESIHIDGMPLHIVDTAGLRESPDTVERIGIERAWQEIDDADRILLVIDSSDPKQQDFESHWSAFTGQDKYRSKLSVILNKIDKNTIAQAESEFTQIALSALTGQGLDALKQHLKEVMSYTGTTEGSFSARRRHLDAIAKAKHLLLNGQSQLQGYAAGELLAEDLRQAQQELCEITGEFTADDLLGEIFSSFCIGK